MQRRTFLGTLAAGFAFLTGVEVIKPNLAAAMPAVQPEPTPLVVTDLWPRVKPLLRADVAANMELTTHSTVVELFEMWSGRGPDGWIILPAAKVSSVKEEGTHPPKRTYPGVLAVVQKCELIEGAGAGPHWAYHLAEMGTGAAIPKVLTVNDPDINFERTTRLVQYLGCEIDTVEEGVVQLAKIIEQFHDRFGIAACLARALAIPLVSGKVMVVSYLAPVSSENIYPSALDREYHFDGKSFPPKPLPEGAVTFEWAMTEGGRGRYVGNNPFDYDAFYKKMHKDINAHAWRCMHQEPGHAWPSEKMVPRGSPAPWSNPS